MGGVPEEELPATPEPPEMFEPPEGIDVTLSSLLVTADSYTVLDPIHVCLGCAQTFQNCDYDNQLGWDVEDFTRWGEESDDEMVAQVEWYD